MSIYAITLKRELLGGAVGECEQSREEEEEGRQIDQAAAVEAEFESSSRSLAGRSGEREGARGSRTVEGEKSESPSCQWQSSAATSRAEKQRRLLNEANWLDCSCGKYLFA